MTFKERLKDWQDFDLASLNLAVSLGLMKEYDKTSSIPHKYVFWSNHPVGEMLAKMLVSLEELGILEFDEDSLKYRWDPNYRGDWDLTEDEKIVRSIIE